jgi:hypothetical protein
VTTLTDYLIKLSEDKEESRKYSEDHEAALAESGLSEENKALLRKDNRNREKIRAAILKESPGVTVMSSFMTGLTVRRPKKAPGKGGGTKAPGTGGGKKHPGGGHRP